MEKEAHLSMISVLEHDHFSSIAGGIWVMVMCSSEASCRDAAQAPRLWKHGVYDGEAMLFLALLTEPVWHRDKAEPKGV